MKCNFDCFNCIYDDCVNDDLIYSDYQQAKSITRQALMDSLDNKYYQNKACQQAYYQANKDKIKAYKQAYYQANKNVDKKSSTLELTR